PRTGSVRAACRAARPNTSRDRGSRGTARRRGPAPAAAVRPRRDGLRSASARCWGISRSRSRAAGPRCPTSPGPPRTATRTRAWPPPPRACAGGAMETACAPPSGRGLRLGSSDLHIPPFRPQLGHEDGPELAGVVALPGAMLGEEARGRRVGVQPRRCEIAVGERRQAAVEPPRYRHREAALAPPDHVVGHEPARRFLYYRLGGQAPHLEPHGRGEDKLQDRALEIGRARFERGE